MGERGEDASEKQGVLMRVSLEAPVVGDEGKSGEL